MQTTLLGLAIAFILALLAALIGPYFVDWNQFRPQFEAEAGKIVGVPVRVAGALDARLLPTPTLRLRQVTFGGANHLGKLRADKLDVEFSLGDLMRGQWKANELTIGGMAADLGLDAKGQVDLPAASGRFNLAALSIDRFNLTGRVALHDAASRSTIELTDIVFSGDVRSLAGSLRGDGAVSIRGSRYPFRLSSSQDKDSNGLRVHLNIDPGERPVMADVEGLISFPNRSPRFEGALTLSSPPKEPSTDKDKPAQAAKDASAKQAQTAKSSPANQAGGTPWRIATKIAGDQASAKLDQIEVTFGQEDRALKFAGGGDVRFGAMPVLKASLSARQLDADKLLAGGDEVKDRRAIAPALVLPALRNWIAQLPTLPMPANVQFSTEQIMLSGRPVQNFTADLHNEPTAWSLEKVDLRAPGSTRLTFRTIGISTSVTAGFTGALDLESSEPDSLVAWLQGRSDTSYRTQRPLRLRGDLNVAPERIAIDGLKADIDGGSVDGRVALLNRPAGAGSRFEAVLKGDRLDLDAAMAVTRSLVGVTGEWPAEASVALDVGRAKLSGQELRPLTARVSYDPKTIAVDQIKFGQSGGVTTEGAGRFDRADATGRLTVTSMAGSLKEITALVQPFAPQISARFDALTTPAGAARLKLTLDLAKDPANADRSQAKAVLDLDAPQLKGSATLTAKPSAAALRSFEVDAIDRTELGVESRLSAEQGSVVLALLGLDRVAAVGNGPAEFQSSVTGSWRAPLRVNAKLSGVGLDGDAQGTVEPWGDAARANVNLRLRSANLAPLLGVKPQDPAAQNIRLFGKLGLSGGRVTLEDIDSTVGGSRLRGRLAVNLDDDRQVDGEVGIDALDVPQVVAVLIGAAGREQAEPLGAGLLKGWRGRVAFQALSGTVLNGTDLRPLAGAIKSDGQSLTIENLKGKLGGGEVIATVEARPNPNGLVLNGRIELAGVDGNALRYRNLKMPAGKVSAQMTLAAEGRSVQGLVNALSGNGTVTLDNASIANLDPRAFDAALRAADAGQVTDDGKLRQVVEPALASGSLSVVSAQIPFIIRDGRVRVGATTLEAQGARAIVSGGFDVPADQADIRASLSSNTTGNANSRPEVQLFVMGTPDALTRVLDVTSLSSWLAVRAIDRETRRLDAIARGEPPPTYPSSTASLPGGPDAAPVTPNATDVPMPGRDPRRDPRTKLGGPRAAVPPLSAPLSAPAAAPPPAAPAAPLAASQPQVAPLPPPVEIKPAPGAMPPRPRPLPRPPVVLTPPGSP
ncbi:membrane protein [Bradyrhizobium sp. SSBR45G]|uniref:AsmA family protein n=1 Tax=unclassified Bradyrhizobium TaxID=2631580 RepID=UPI0023428FC2|nr:MULTISPECIES: AsmA family protein [unclassified Bradyrhizobium]GLH79477.1 membrane protein [Bradyrhizobium sp. SSBR45G]GLH86854.1 membrane protein [Bradyrhizobium sp. SSBR45R]